VSSPNIKFIDGVEWRRIRFLQYRANWKHPFGQLISLYTGLYNWGTPPYCHSEICFSNSICFSAANRKDGFIGTRYIDYEILTRNKKRWDIYELWVPADKEERMIGRASRIINKGYDWLGIIGFFSPKNIQDKNKWYCSECVYYVYNEKNIRISPRRLTRWILRIGGKLVSRKGRLIC